jgi:hypothetical protein
MLSLIGFANPTGIQMFSIGVVALLSFFYSLFSRTFTSETILFSSAYYLGIFWILGIYSNFWYSLWLIIAMIIHFAIFSHNQKIELTIKMMWVGIIGNIMLNGSLLYLIDGTYLLWGLYAVMVSFDIAASSIWIKFKSKIIG